MLAEILALAFEKHKTRIRAIVEHPFHVVKNIFKHKKARYIGTQEERCTVECASHPEQLVHGKGEVVPVVAKIMSIFENGGEGAYQFRVSQCRTVYQITSLIHF